MASRVSALFVLLCAAPHETTDTRALPHFFQPSSALSPHTGSNFEPSHGSSAATSRAASGAASNATSGTKPLLLYLPGLDGSGGGGAIQWRRLRVSFEIWALHLPPGDRSTFAALCKTTEDFLRRKVAPRVEGAGANRPALLVGESSGAVLALGVGLRAPELVFALCIVNPATGYHRSAVLPRLASLVPHLPTALYENVPGFFAPLLGKPGWLPPLLPADAAPPARARPASPLETLRVSRALAAVLPAETLRWRLEEHLFKGGEAVTHMLSRFSESEGGTCRAAPHWAAATVLLAGTSDIILDSKKETRRLAAMIPGACRRLLAGAAHACLDDDQVNLRLELQLSGVLGSLLNASSALDRPHTMGAGGLPTPTPQNLFEVWTREMQKLFSPVFYATSAGGAAGHGAASRVSRTLEAMPPMGTGSRPLLFVGNHQLYGFDAAFLIDEIMRERGVCITSLAYPPLLEGKFLLKPLPLPLPGTAEAFKRFGAVPTSARNLFRALSRGEHVLLFPGGGREVFKRKGEHYTLFWPQQPELVRLAARFNATIVPVSGLGGDDSFRFLVDTEEILKSPLGGFFKARTAHLPAPAGEGDVFVPPLGVFFPERYYFLFGRPIHTETVDTRDEAAVQSVYDAVRASVYGGIDTLREIRERDPYAGFVRRISWEIANGIRAPAPEPREHADECKRHS